MIDATTLLKELSDILAATEQIARDALEENKRLRAELISTNSFLKQVADQCALAEAEVIVLRAENAELVEAMHHPSYEEENRLRAELANFRRMHEIYVQETVDLRAELDALKTTPPAVPDLLAVVQAAYEMTSAHDEREPFDWAVLCEMLYQGIAKAKAAPTPPSVPSAKQLSDHKSAAYVLGWNECRAAMIQATPKPGEQDD